jgi:transcription antitermination factor NusG
MASAHSPSFHTSPIGEEYPWFAVQVQTRYEKAVAKSLRSRGLDDFLPTYRCTRRWSDRLQKIEMPLFPGYVFSRFDINDRLPVLTIPGVIGIIGAGKLPQPVDQAEIDALQIVVASGLLLEPWPFLKEGQRVRIDDGPLRNVEGVLTEIGDRGKLIVSVSLLRRSIAVTVDRNWIRPIFY